MKKIHELNNSILWDNKLSNLKQYQPETDSFWDFVLKLDLITKTAIFKDNEEYYDFLADFWFNLNPNSISQLQATKLYIRLFHSISSNENLLFFLAEINHSMFEFFEILLNKYKFLLANPKTLSEEEFIYYNKFWTALFKQNNVSITFLNKHYYYFYNNRDYFYSKVCSHKNFFNLNQSLINKFKAKGK